MQCLNSSQSLAWFNLFEPISKKERERALFCSRLLSHSLKSESFREQIFGDVYLSLDEVDLALSSYNRAFTALLQENNVYGLLVITNKIVNLKQPCKNYIESANSKIDKKNRSHMLFFNEIIKKEKSLTI
jgi:hypothetical protein